MEPMQLIGDIGDSVLLRSFATVSSEIAAWNKEVEEASLDAERELQNWREKVSSSKVRLESRLQAIFAQILSDSSRAEVKAAHGCREPCLGILQGNIPGAVCESTQRDERPQVLVCTGPPGDGVLPPGPNLKHAKRMPAVDDAEAPSQSVHETTEAATSYSDVANLRTQNPSWVILNRAEPNEHISNVSPPCDVSSGEAVGDCSPMSISKSAASSTSDASPPRYAGAGHWHKHEPVDTARKVAGKGRSRLQQGVSEGNGSNPATLRADRRLSLTPGEEGSCITPSSNGPKSVKTLMNERRLSLNQGLEEAHTLHSPLASHLLGIRAQSLGAAPSSKPGTPRISRSSRDDSRPTSKSSLHLSKEPEIDQPMSADSPIALAPADLPVAELAVAEEVSKSAPGWATQPASPTGVSTRVSSWVQRTSKNLKRKSSLGTGLASFLGLRVDSAHAEPKRGGADKARPMPKRERENSNLTLLLDRVQKFSDDAWDVRVNTFMVLKPNSFLRRAVDKLVLYILLDHTFVLPFRLSFGTPDTVFWTIWDAVSNAVFIVDVILNFFTAIIDDEDLPITSHKEIARRYLQSWFVLDVTAAIPWDQLVAFIDLYATESISRLMGILRMVRVVRMLKVLFNVQEHSPGRQQPGRLRLAKFTLFFTTVVHWFTCLTHSIASQNEDHTIDDFFEMANYRAGSPRLQYEVCLYWTTTVMTGSKATPGSEATILLTTIVFWIGSTLLVATFGNIIRLMGEVDFAESQHRLKVEKATAYMHRLKIPPRLQQRVMDYFELLYAQTSGIDGQEFMTELPPHLRQEVAIFLNRGVLESMPLFEDCSVPFLVAVLMRLKLSVGLTDDLVITEGEIGYEMFIILQGRVSILINNRELGQLSKGDFFGEGGLVNGTGRRGGSVRCLKTSIFYVLGKESFDAVREAYPEDCEVFLEVAKRRVKARSVINNEEFQSEEDAALLREEEEALDRALRENSKRHRFRDLVRGMVM
ncbi:hypothetical protein CYMTET_46897 [Cymbomonas tetramitiformis]|uniref:Cyclic nucleotide-binding domain-containing protein n=1 Tax=Cymbomonas tetramitiformis TaxID=36881 RepID=A0AAE0BV91_9CHLO|nr:hypothetical protein CYMTET_46897 [Cymbomonas tetramitiformis]